MPKVSPPVGSVGNRQTGNVLDKIQAELAETKRREDELRRQRRDVMQEVLKSKLKRELLLVISSL